MNSGINGFGRIGRLMFPALWGRTGIELVHVNDPAGDARTAAHLLAFDSVLAGSGKFKTPQTLKPCFDQVGLNRVLVACPVKGQIEGAQALHIVFGINHHLYAPSLHRLVMAVSCTTNCLAPVVKVVHESFGIRHGSITTLYDVTNTQVVVDALKSDLRRARSCTQSLIPIHLLLPAQQEAS